MDHTTPSEAIFNEIKDAAIKVWKTKDNTYGYVDEKVATVESTNNVEDNIMICYRMFDYKNQYLMEQELSEEAIQYINQNK